MFRIERRDSGSNWYLYSTTSNEFSATAMAEVLKRSYPKSSIRVLDSRGSVRAIF